MKIRIGKYPRNGDLPKVDIRIDDYDLWSADFTMSLVIYEVLMRYRSNIRSVPSSILQEIYGKSYSSTDEYVADQNLSFATDYWVDTIDRMIFSFREISTNYPTEYELLNKKDEDELLAAYHKDIQDGIDLFAKHYRSLWN